ncbi:MAG: sugar ABC transporter substrate-binding protein [Phycisphaerales bacterium]|nr:MAG: sugar ABC transporter substrate-binding protein [Phycisphaerales bacterium]
MRARIFLVGFVAVVIWATAQCRRAPEDTDTQVITVWAHHGREAENLAMRRIIDAFNEAHRALGLRAEITFFPDRQYADKVSIASASGSLPDVLEVDGPYVGPWAAEGLLQPIDDFVRSELRDDMLPSLIQQGTFRGSLYTLGAFDSALVVYYNRDIVEKNGLMPPGRLDDAWTWDQFLDALEHVKPHAAVPLSLHMDDQSDEWFTYAFSPLIWSNGGRLIGADGLTVVGVLDSPENTAAIRRWQDLFQRKLAEPTSTNPNPFAAGLAAFDWTGHWMLPSFEHTEGLRFGVMPLPRTGSVAACASGSWCWGLSRDCDDPAASWLVIEWLLDPEQGIQPIVRANGAVPGRRSAFALFPEYEHMPRRLFREQLESAAHPRPRTAIYLSLTSAFARALRDIALGADVQTALRQAAESAQRVANRQHDKPGPSDNRP